MEKWIYTSPIGDIIILSHNDYLKGLWFHDQAYVGAGFNLEDTPTQFSVFNERVSNWLDAYFNQKNPDPTLIPIDLEVTEFREKVLSELSNTKYGELRSYKNVFELMNEGNEKTVGSIRSVGGAIGHNPVSIIIPCHRVVSTNGDLTGYAGGIERKKYLLRLEGHVIND